jgi:hypothetical protein
LAGPPESCNAKKPLHPSWPVASDLGLWAADGGMAMSLTAEQCRALAMLGRADLDGASQTLLMAHGFCASMIVGLVNNGLATLTREKLWAGGRLMQVAKVRITAAGRRALITQRSAFYPAGITSVSTRTRLHQWFGR